jgi:hypothetical protein
MAIFVRWTTLRHPDQGRVTLAVRNGRLPRSFVARLPLVRWQIVFNLDFAIRRSIADLFPDI